MKANLPPSEFFLGRQVPGNEQYKVAELLGSGVNGLIFRAHSDELVHDLACKIIPRTNLIGTDDNPQKWLEEIQKANVLLTPVVVKVNKTGEWVDADHGIDCKWVMSDYVKGWNLDQYIHDHKRSLDMLFVEDFLTAMFQFLDAMKRRNVRHGDIHSKNILVEDCRDQLGQKPYAIRVTDFGVTSSTSDSELRDDYEQIAHVLRLLLEKVSYQAANARDRYAYNVVNDHFLARHLSEPDPSRDPLARNPEGLYQRLHKIDADYIEKESRSSSQSLKTPFDYLSCEQIGEAHSLLQALYSSEFLALGEIESRNNLVLTGPRGCGKSTVFKSLSLKHRYFVNGDLPDSVEFVGIYYRCDDLWSAFQRYKLPDQEAAYDIPIHYLTATLLAETLSTIQLWGSRHYAETLSRIESSLATEIWSALELEPPRTPAANTIAALVARLQKERLRAAKKQRFGAAHPTEHLFSAVTLVAVCNLISRNLDFLRARPFYFFIDDYSSPKITSDLQKNLNRLFMQRHPNCFFKLSTESPVSYVRSDVDSKEYVEGREFNLVNLGTIFLNAQEKVRSQFIEDIFARRFSAISEYPVQSLVELIGVDDDRQSGNDMALAIRNNKKIEYWGRDTLCDLCSGDIFYIIRLVGSMVTEIGGTERLLEMQAQPKIQKKVQTKVVRNEAGEFLRSLRGTKDGEHLVSVVTAFGNVANSYLKFRNSKNEAVRPPHQASRIEPYDELNLNAKAQGVYNELLRYSLFIEDVRGKSIRGKFVPRLYLRRLLLPQFKLTFSRRDSVSLENADFELLLTNPTVFEDRFRLHVPGNDATSALPGTEV